MFVCVFCLTALTPRYVTIYACLMSALQGFAVPDEEVPGEDY